MKITPNTVSLLEGMTAQCVIEDVPDSEVFEWQVSYSVTGIVTASIDERHIVTLTSVADGSAVVTISYVTPSETIQVQCEVTVLTVDEFEDITRDGTGTDDATIFTRQYIINNNLKRISALIDVIDSNIQTVELISGATFAMASADFVAILTNLDVLKDAISKISGSSGKNTVSIPNQGRR